jgi:carotenoid cleavage dioxygenase-like enzyme
MSSVPRARAITRVNPYLSGNFSPVLTETTTTRLDVRGQIPSELDGRLLRIGHSPAGPVDPERHHWIGRSPIRGPGDGYGAVNTHVTTVGGRVLALVEAGGLPIELNDGLESTRRSDFEGTLRGGFAAHPKLDPRTGFGPAFKHDVQTARTEVHDFGPGRLSLEPVFVPRTAYAAEDDGYVMAYVYDENRDRSDGRHLVGTRLYRATPCHDRVAGPCAIRLSRRLGADGIERLLRMEK